MKRIYFFLLALAAISPLLMSCDGKKAETVVIEGRVTDYDGNPMKDVSVGLHIPTFLGYIHETFTNDDGYYSFEVKRGKYMAFSALNMDEYPVTGSVLPEEDQRLEFWAWNFIADRDMTFNIRYHRLEVYGMNVFQVQGATPGYTIYCRPMSLTRHYENQRHPSPYYDLAPPVAKAEVTVTVNDESATVRTVQRVNEYFDETEFGDAYLIFADRPAKRTEAPYDIIRVTITDLENGDKGEAVYFVEYPDYLE